MSNYTKSTDFASKDTLPSGDSAKIVRGTEIDAEFEALETAVNSKYDSSSTIPVANGGTGDTTAAGARTNLGLAPIASSGSASDLSLGTVPTARLGSGTASSSTYLRGDNTWATILSTPAGVVIFFAANSAPTGYLKANGAAVSRTTYSDLFTAIGTTFGTGDGSTTFNLPDMRGYFARGWVDNGSVDSGRTFGSTQSDANLAHTHTLSGSYAGDGGSGAGGAPGMDSSGTITTSSSGSTEARPKNVAFLACIKY